MCARVPTLLAGQLLVFLATTHAYAQTPVLPATPFDYAGIQLPDHYLNNDFPAQVAFQTAAIDHDSTPLDNPITNAGATLGRVLFYEKKLSASETISCASCHRQEFGFSDPDQFSFGHAGGETRRHSMGLANARFNARGRYFWDERTATLEDQVLMPIQDDVEMGLTLAEAIAVVESQTYYDQLFIDAFGDDTVTAERMSLALAQFVRSLVSFTAPYDEGRTMVTNPLAPFPNFTDAENRGKDLFHIPGTNGINCAGCHASEAFLNVIPINNPPPFITHAINNGIDLVSTDDLGVEESSGLAFDEGKFRMPSLRNIAIRPPYAHDGRFADLDALIDFYSTGIQPHANITPALLDEFGQVRHFNFTEQEKADLIAFLHTLTDDAFLTDEKFSDPFPVPEPGVSGLVISASILLLTGLRRKKKRASVRVGGA